jgi:transposase-like protein
MRMRVQIPAVEPAVMNAPRECPMEGCEGKHFKTHQAHCNKTVRDTKYEKVIVYRRKCLRCRRTHRVYPRGVSQAQQTARLKGASILLYLLGVSYRGVEDLLTALGFYLSHSTVYRNVQAAGKKARKLRHVWLEQHRGKVQIVAGDLTYMQRQGEGVIIGVAVDAQQGITLDITLLENQETETLNAWLQPLLALTGAEVFISDDADGFKAVTDQAGVEHQICRRHVTLNVLDFIAKSAERILRQPPAVPQELDVTPEQMLADLETLEWIIVGLPEHGAKLLAEIYSRYAQAPAPPRGKRATIWYRMRNRVLHLWDNWQRLTCFRVLQYTKQLQVAETNNCTEQAIGWTVKERYRTMRGYKRDQSILNVTSLTAWLLQQSAGYDISPLVSV